MAAFRKLASLAAQISLIVATSHVSGAQDPAPAQLLDLSRAIGTDIDLRGQVYGFNGQATDNNARDGSFSIRPTSVDTELLIDAANTFDFKLGAEQKRRAKDTALDDSESTFTEPCRICDVAEQWHDYQYRLKH